MLRHCAWSLAVLVTFIPSASAEKITFQRQTQQVSEPTDLSVHTLLADPLFQQSVIDAAPDGWRDTPGADIWWTPFDGESYKVLVLPSSSKGKPGWHFELDGTRFWMKIQGIALATSNGSAAGPSGSGPNGPLPAGGRRGEQSFQGAESGNASGVGGDLPNGLNTPLPWLLPGDGGTIDPVAALESITGPFDGDSLSAVIAQAPEPSLLVLLGLAGLSAARRIRARQR